MSRFLLACGFASAICLTMLAAQATTTVTPQSTSSQPLQYSRPAADGLLAQSEFVKQCRKQCEQTAAACQSRNANDPSCGNNYNTCTQGCRGLP
jgi:hypothetical protein